MISCLHKINVNTIVIINIASMFAICGARHGGGPHSGGSGVIFAPVRFTK